MTDEPNDAWPRGLLGSARHADPADPLSPQPPAHGDVERRLRAHARRQLPHLASADLRPVQFAEAYAKLAAIAMARAEFYGQILTDLFGQWDEHGHIGAFDDTWNEDDDYDPGRGDGLKALVGNTYDLSKEGLAVPTGEAIRALVKLEAEERDRAAKLMRDGIRIGIEAKQVDVMRSYGRTVVASMRALCLEMGIDWGDESTRLAARRAIISARTSLGDLLAPSQQEVEGA